VSLSPRRDVAVRVRRAQTARVGIQSRIHANPKKSDGRIVASRCLRSTATGEAMGSWRPFLVVVDGLGLQEARRASLGEELARAANTAEGASPSGAVLTREDLEALSASLGIDRSLSKHEALAQSLWVAVARCNPAHMERVRTEVELPPATQQPSSLPQLVGAAGAFPVLVVDFPRTALELEAVAGVGMRVGEEHPVQASWPALPPGLWDTEHKAAYDKKHAPVADPKAAKGAKGTKAVEAAVVVDQSAELAKLMSEAVPVVPLIGAMSLRLEGGVPEPAPVVEVVEEAPAVEVAAKGGKPAKKSKAELAAEEEARLAKEKAEEARRVQQEELDAARAAGGGVVGFDLFAAMQLGDERLRAAVSGLDEWQQRMRAFSLLSLSTGRSGEEGLAPLSELAPRAWQEALEGECARRAYQQWSGGVQEVLDIPAAHAVSELVPRFPSSHDDASAALLKMEGADAEAQCLLSCYQSLLEPLPEAAISAVSVAVALREAVALVAGEPFDCGYSCEADLSRSLREPVADSSEEAKDAEGETGRVCLGLGSLSLPAANRERQRRVVRALGGPSDPEGLRCALDDSGVGEPEELQVHVSEALAWAGTAASGQAGDLLDASHTRLLRTCVQLSEPLSRFALNGVALAALERAVLATVQLPGMGSPGHRLCDTVRHTVTADVRRRGDAQSRPCVQLSGEMPLGAGRLVSVFPQVPALPLGEQKARLAELACFTSVPSSVVERTWKLRALRTLLDDWEWQSRQNELRMEPRSRSSGDGMDMEAEQLACVSWEMSEWRWGRKLSASALVQQCLLGACEAQALRAVYDETTDSAAIVLHRPTPRCRRRAETMCLGEFAMGGMSLSLDEWRSMGSWRQVRDHCTQLAGDHELTGDVFVEPCDSVQMRSAVSLDAVANRQTEQVLMFPSDGSLVRVERTASERPVVTVTKGATSFGLRALGEAPLGEVRALSSDPVNMSDTALTTRGRPSDPTGQCLFFASLAADGQGPDTHSLGDTVLSARMVSAPGRRPKAGSAVPPVWGEITAATTEQVVSVRSDGFVVQRSSWQVDNPLCGGSPTQLERASGSLLELARHASSLFQQAETARVVQTGNALTGTGAGRWAWPQWLPEKSRSHHGKMASVVRHLVRGVKCVQLPSGSVAWWVPGAASEWLSARNGAALDAAEEGVEKEDARDSGDGCWFWTAPNGARSVQRVAGKQRGPVVRLPPLPVMSTVDSSSGCIVSVRYDVCPVADPVAEDIVAARIAMTQSRQELALPRYRQAREMLLMKLLQQRLAEEHSAERRELHGGFFSGCEVDEEGAPATILGAGLSRVGGEEAHSAAGRLSVPWWEEPAGRLQRTTVVQYPNGNVSATFEDGTHIVSEAPERLNPSDEEDLSKLFQHAHESVGDKHSFEDWATRSVGMSIASGGAPTARRVVVVAPGFATVEVEPAYHDAAEQHSRGESVKLTSSGMRTRLTVAFADNSIISTDYDVDVTARVASQVRFHRADGTDLVLQDDGQVSFRLEETGAEDEGIRSAAAEDAAQRAGAKGIRGLALAEAAPSREAFAGCYCFGLLRGEMQLLDSERNRFLVGPFGETLVEVAGAVAIPREGSKGFVLFPPLRQPAPPRVFLLPPLRGGNAPFVEELIGRHSWTRWLSSVCPPDDELDGSRPVGRLQLMAPCYVAAPGGDNESEAEGEVFGTSRPIQRPAGDGQGTSAEQTFVTLFLSGGEGAGNDGQSWAGRAVSGGREYILASARGWIRPPTYPRERPTRAEVFGSAALPTPGELRRERLTRSQRGELDEGEAVVFVADSSERDSPRGSGGVELETTAESLPSRLVAEVPLVVMGIPQRAPSRSSAAMWSSVVERDELTLEARRALAVDEDACEAWRRQIAATNDRFTVVDPRDSRDVSAEEEVSRKIIQIRFPGSTSAEAVGIPSRPSTSASSRSRTSSRSSKSRIAIVRSVRAAGGPALHSESEKQLADAMMHAAASVKLDQRAAEEAQKAAAERARLARLKALEARHDRWRSLQDPNALLPQRGFVLPRAGSSSPWGAFQVPSDGTVTLPATQDASFAVKRHASGTGFAAAKSLRQAAAPIE
jgi:hypothetical protein